MYLFLIFCKKQGLFCWVYCSTRTVVSLLYNLPLVTRWGHSTDISIAESGRAQPLVVVVQSLSPVRLFTTPRQASLSFTISLSLLKLMSIDVIQPVIFCHPLLLLPSIFPSIRVFSKESTLRIRWPKYWNFSISPSKEYSGLISFRIDWSDVLTVQRTLKSLLQ